MKDKFKTKITIAGKQSGQLKRYIRKHWSLQANTMEGKLQCNNKQPALYLLS